MATTTAHWKLIASSKVLQRSSQALSVIGERAYVFGGELRPREPRDNDVHTVELQGNASLKSASNDPSPTPRVGTPSTTVGSSLYLYSGRGGTAMTPIEESGAVWCFDANTETWNLLHPNDDTALYPPARSYHSTTSDGVSKIYVHAGCPEKGRLADLCSFDTDERRWTELASAPGPPRGGTSIAYLDGKIYRMGGFDGKHELGGAIDVYDIATNTWTTISFQPDGVEGPGNRSVSTLLALQVKGKKSLITMFGEADPSSLGHAGAGKMLPDAWVWDVEGRTWSKVVSSGDVPQPRGWFDADVACIDGLDAVVVQGGLADSNERLDDIWILEF